MSTYVLLVSFTDKGRRNFKQEYTESRESNLIHNALWLDKTRREAVQSTSNRQGIPLDSVR
jgi:uncharacterized protein with GYD domain